MSQLLIDQANMFSNAATYEQDVAFTPSFLLEDDFTPRHHRAASSPSLTDPDSPHPGYVACTHASYGIAIRTFVDAI